MLSSPWTVHYSFEGSVSALLGEDSPGKIRLMTIHAANRQSFGKRLAQ